MRATKTTLILSLYTVHDLTNQILEKRSESFSNLFLPMDVIQALYTEGVISKKTFDEVERSGGLVTAGPLQALHYSISKDPNQLRIFSSVLLQSEETVNVGKDTLKDYGKYSYNQQLYVT